jgi:DNA-directed RNA polymerase specialized sigma subunit
MRLISMQMSEELGREPTDAEFAEEVGISSRIVSQLKAAAARHLRRWTPRSAKPIRLNLVRSLEMKMLKRRSSCSETTTCAMG